MNPDGIGQQILPGNFVIKKNPKTGAEKKVILEHALGFFWAFKVGVVYCHRCCICIFICILCLYACNMICADVLLLFNSMGTTCRT